MKIALTLTLLTLTFTSFAQKKGGPIVGKSYGKHNFRETGKFENTV